MGATYVDYRLPANFDKKQIEAWYTNEVAKMHYEYGHNGYTGQICETSGITITDKTFETRQEADEWLDQNCLKWEDALVVKCPEGWIVGAVCSE